MGFQVSPGVVVKEIDLTTIVPSVPTSIGAFAGPFSWGPANEITTVHNEVDLVNQFFKPSATNYEYWYSAANFLAYSGNLQVVRAANTTSTLNAVSTGAGILIENENDYEYNHSTSANTNGSFAARYPGELGNGLKIDVVDANTFSSSWAHFSQFTDAPGTSSWAEQRGGANDEVHIVIVDTRGDFSGTANTVIEKYAFVSKASDALTNDGSTNYYVNVLNQRSRYIWWLSHPELANNNWGYVAANTNFKNLSTVLSNRLQNGADGTLSSRDIIRGYDAFVDPEISDISLIVSGPANGTIATHIIDNICETRRDCIVFVSPQKDDVVHNYLNEEADIKEYRASLTSTSYAVIDSGWKYQYDKYNDVYRWLPLNADVAGLCARTDNDRDPWYSPAGLNRGIIKNVIRLAWNPNKSNRDNLYLKGVNPIVTFPGEGTMLYGDKTMLSRPSAFDRINVRRLFIVLEKSIAKAARSTLFEFNDAFTRAQFVNLVEPYLRDVKGRRGIYDFRVVCDETNNTPEVIDRNEFIGDIYIKPARSINFITLNFIAVRTGVAFEEVIGKWG